MTILDYLELILATTFFRETLDTRLDDDSWTYCDDKKEYFVKKFSLDNDDYILNFNSFVIKDDDNNIYNKIYNVNFSKVVDGRRNIGILNTGHAFQVFSIVSQMIEKFLNGSECNPNGFFFSAREPSRKRLYKRYAEIIDTKFCEMFRRVYDFNKFNMFKDYKKDELFLFMKNSLCN